MALVSTGAGLWFPVPFGLPNFPTTGTASLGAIDAATEKIGYCGRIYIEGRATGKTISEAGGGSISFMAASVTFANGATSVTVGLQDLGAASREPDGGFDVNSAALVGGGGGIANGWNTITMTGGAGTKTLNHGDRISVVIDMTARGGADTITTTSFYSAAGTFIAKEPYVGVFTAAAWSFASNGIPNCLITFDDGTLGILDFGWPVQTISSEAVTDTTTPDEIGLQFEMPWDCQVDAFYTFCGPLVGVNSDFTMKLYSDPTGSPTLLTSVAVLAENLSSTSTAEPTILTLPTPINLTHGVTYGVTIRGTGSSNVPTTTMVLASEDYRVFWPASTTQSKISRSNDTGAFAAESPAVTHYIMGVRINAFAG